MGNVNMEASQVYFRGGEKKMSVEEALKNTSGEAAAIAQLQADVLNLNSNKANQITISPFFSAEASYDPGDLVYYNGLSYRCVNAHEGEWDADDFAATTIAGELDTLKNGLTNLIEDTARGAKHCYPIITKNNYAAISLPKGNTYTISGNVGILGVGGSVIPDCRESGTDGFVVPFASASDGYYIIALIGTYADTYVGYALDLTLVIS